MLRVLIVIAAIAVAHPVGAQSYPAKPIRVIWPYAPGSAPESVGRVLAQGVGEILRQPVVFENRAGANGIIGTEAAAKAPADGYTIHWTVMSAFVLNEFLKKSLPYDARRDFAPVTKAAEILSGVMINASVPASTFRDFLDHAKKSGGKLTYGSFGQGSLAHLYGEMVNSAAGTELLHVPYAGGGQVVTDLLAGRVDATFLSIGSVIEHWKSGKVKVLAVTRPKRLPALPNVPSVLEDLTRLELIDNWMGFFVPQHVPRPIILRLNGAIVKALSMPEIEKRFNDLYYPPVGNTPDEFAAALKQDFAAATTAFKAAGIQPE